MTEAKRDFGIFLTFNGQCTQALQYYKKCFGGTLLVQTMADVPIGRKLGKCMQHIVVSATLTNSYFKIVATDLTGEAGVIIGNNVSILVECASPKERDRLHHFLSGTVNSLQEDNLICVLDKYNVNWILSIK